MGDFELRWLVPAETTTDKPRLQFRRKQFYGGNALAPAWKWSEWQDIPVVIEKDQHHD